MTGRRAIIRFLQWGFTALIGVIIISYAVWRSLNYARGPEIAVLHPTADSGIASSTTPVDGTALRIKTLSLNGRPISIEENGHFHEYLIIFPGINYITLDGADQFGRSIREIVRVVGLATSTTQIQPSRNLP